MLRWIPISSEWRAARILAAVLILLYSTSLYGGGPLHVAGVSWFNPGIAGTPLLWSGGVVNYYTDQGNLSPVLNGAAADAFVADAFSRWTSIPTAAVAANRAGQLAEDVSGSNVYGSNGQIIMPDDILPSAIGKPLGI